MKEYGAPWVEKVMRNTPNTAGMLTALKHHRVIPTPTLKSVDQVMVAVLSFEIGGALETAKKLWENYQAEHAPPTKKAVLSNKPAAKSK